MQRARLHRVGIVLVLVTSMAVPLLAVVNLDRLPAAAAGTPLTAYVVNLDGNPNSISAIDTSSTPPTVNSNTIGSPCSCTNPAAMAITPDGSTAYLAGNNPFGLTSIALTPGGTSPGTVGTTFAPSPPPTNAFATGIAIAPDGSTVYVVDDNNDVLDAFDNITDAWSTVPLPSGEEPDGIAISTDGTTAYVSNSDGTVSVAPLNGSPPPPSSSVTLPTPLGALGSAGPENYGIAVSPDGSLVWVVDGLNYVFGIDTTTDMVTHQVEVGTAALSSIAVAPDGTVWVASGSGNAVDAVAPPFTAVTASVTVPNAGPLAVTPDGADVYASQAANIASTTVSVINTAGSPSVTPVTVGFGPSAIAITPDQAPQAGIGADLAILGSPTTFTDTGPPAGITDYQWSFGDGTSISTAAPTVQHTYGAPGSYTASVTETDSAGTSTMEVFTGQTMSRNGGASASASTTAIVAPATPPSTTTTSVPLPGTTTTTSVPTTTTTTTAPAPTTTTTTAPAPTATTTTAAPTTTTTAAPSPNNSTTTTSTTTTTTTPAKVHRKVSPAIHNRKAPPSTPANPATPQRPGPLGEIPPSGTPGMAVTLDEHLPARTCRSGTVYVFFDSQLVSEGPEHGAEFIDSGVDVPGDAAPGWHHFELNCTDVDPWLQSARFDVLSTTNHPMGWITALPRAGHVKFDRRTVVQAGALAVGLVSLIVAYLMGFPQEWFNDTYESNKERLVAAARRRVPGYFEERTTTRPWWWRAGVTTGLFIVFLALAGFLNALLDPKFGWNPSSAWFFLGWCAGIFVITMGFQLPAVVLGVRTRRGVGLHILVGSIVVATICVAVSRALHIEPGYCYGLLAVFAFRPAIEERMTGKLAAFSALCVLLLSIVAGVIWIPVQQLAAHPGPGPALLTIEAMLAAVFVAGIQSVTFGMLPLPFLPGKEVASWNKLAWLGVFGLGVFGMSWMLLQPGSGYPDEVQHLDIVPIAIAFGSFALVTVAFMLYLRLRRPPAADAADRDVEGETAPVSL